MNNTTQSQLNSDITSEERLLALLSHLSIFLGGIILPFIIWITQKDKSKFIRFHSLQSIFFQLSMIVILLIFIIIAVIIMVVSGIGFAGSEGESAGFSIGIIIGMIILYGGIFIIIFGGIVYSVYLSIKSYNGDLIKIPIIGNNIYSRVYGQQDIQLNRS